MHQLPELLLGRLELDKVQLVGFGKYWVAHWLNDVPHTVFGVGGTVTRIDETWELLEQLVNL